MERKFLILFSLIISIFIPVWSEYDHFMSYLGKTYKYSTIPENTEIIPFRIKGDSVLIREKEPFFTLDSLILYKWDMIKNKKLVKWVKPILEDTTDYNGSLAVLCFQKIRENGGNSGFDVCSQEFKKVAPHGFVYSWGWRSNLIGDDYPYFHFTNLYEKTIKYITFYVQFFNGVGDPIICRSTKSSVLPFTGIGPVKEGETKYWNWSDDVEYYIRNAKSAEIKKIVIEYIDGSKYTLIKEIKIGKTNRSI